MDRRTDSRTERQTCPSVGVVALNGDKKNSNKTVNTTASVTYGWRGALMRFRLIFGKNFKSDWQTNGQTDGPTVSFVTGD